MPTSGTRTNWSSGPLSEVVHLIFDLIWPEVCGIKQQKAE